MTCPLQRCTSSFSLVHSGLWHFTLQLGRGSQVVANQRSTALGCLYILWPGQWCVFRPWFFSMRTCGHDAHRLLLCSAGAEPLQLSLFLDVVSAMLAHNRQQFRNSSGTLLGHPLLLFINLEQRRAVTAVLSSSSFQTADSSLGRAREHLMTAFEGTTVACLVVEGMLHSFG